MLRACEGGEGGGGYPLCTCFACWQYSCVPWPQHPYDEIIKWYEQLAQDYESVVNYVPSIGKSLEGRDQPAVHITANPGTDKNFIYFQCQIHASMCMCTCTHTSWCGPCIQVLHLCLYNRGVDIWGYLYVHGQPSRRELWQRLKGESNGLRHQLYCKICRRSSVSELLFLTASWTPLISPLPQITALLEKVEFIFIPFMNPDGYVVSHVTHSVYLTLYMYLLAF